MDKKFKNNACLKTPANSGVISQVYQNAMALFKHYAQVGFLIEVQITFAYWLTKWLGHSL